MRLDKFENYLSNSCDPEKPLVFCYGESGGVGIVGAQGVSIDVSNHPTTGVCMRLVADREAKPLTGQRMLDKVRGLLQKYGPAAQIRLVLETLDGFVTPHCLNAGFELHSYKRNLFEVDSAVSRDRLPVGLATVALAALVAAAVMFCFAAGGLSTAAIDPGATAPAAIPAAFFAGLVALRTRKQTVSR